MWYSYTKGAFLLIHWSYWKIREAFSSKFIHRPLSSCFAIYVGLNHSRTKRWIIWQSLMSVAHCFWFTSTYFLSKASSRIILWEYPLTWFMSSAWLSMSSTFSIILLFQRWRKTLRRWGNGNSTGIMSSGRYNGSKTRRMKLNYSTKSSSIKIDTMNHLKYLAKWSW